MSKKKITVHYSKSSKEKTTTKDINDWHKNRNWGNMTHPIKATKSELGFYVQYHEVIEANGASIKCREDHETAWHSGNTYYNNNAYAICVINDGEEDLNNEQVYRLRDSLTDACKRFGLTKNDVGGHKDVVPTHCPGDKLKTEFLRSLVKIKEKPKKKEDKESIKKQLIVLINKL